MRTPPNQVTYLKGSSMESFTLGFLPKIDFNMGTATVLRQRLESKLISTITPKLYSLSSKEFNTEFLQINAYKPLFIGYRRPKSSLNQFSLGGVQIVAKRVQTANCAISFSNSLIFFPE
jgi:hypothetical protein